MKRSYIIALAIAALMIVWMASGQLSSGGADKNGTGNGGGTADRAFLVRTDVFNASPRQAQLLLRGRTQALRTVSVKAETMGRVTELPAVEGGPVAENDVICQLDVQDKELRVDEARASLRQRQIEFDAASKLSTKGFQSETQKAGARAALDTAKARLKAAELDLQHTRIKAPFDGILDRVDVEIGDLMQVGNVCGVVVDQDPFLVIAQVSEIEVGQITVGAPATAQLVSGESVEGTVRYLATRADQQTRTFRMEIEVANPDGYLRDGITAEIRVPVREVRAHLISPGVLTLDTDGQIGVRTVVDGKTVRFRPVTIIDADSDDGVWVAGLPERVEIITVGQDFVVDGQTVRVAGPDDAGEIEAEPESASSSGGGEAMLLQLKGLAP